MLTQDQISHFEAFGFLMLRRLFSPGEVEELRREAISVLDEDRDGLRFQGDESQTVMQFFERRPAMRTLLEDDRIYKVAEGLLGPGFVLVLTEAHLSVGDTQWHGDSRTRGILPNVKMGVYLDTVTADTGCLRVVPGSHRSPLFESLAPLKLRFDDPDANPFGVSGAGLPCVALESQPGDVVVFTEEVYHAAFGGRAGRLRLALNFDCALTTDARVECVRKEYEKTHYMYRPARSLVESGRPRLEGMVAPLLGLGFDTLDA